MNGMNRSLGLILSFCILIAVVSIGISMVYNPFGVQEERENETIKYAREKSILETGKENEEGAYFQWIGHSFLSESTVSMQIKYNGPPLEHFDEKGIVFLVNGRTCTWAGRIVKGQGGRMTLVNDGESIYILATFECTLRKGDTLTFQYQPLNIETSTQL